MKFKNMFSPIQIGPMTVKNRFVVPPMGNNFANSDGTWSDESVAYYGERAKGQFGLITIEATVVHKGAKGGPKKPCLYDDNSIESLRKLTDACHEEGAKVIYPASECRTGRKCKECRSTDPGCYSNCISRWKRHS